MKAPDLETSDPSIVLVEPDLKRDPALSVEWLKGEHGRNTLSMMGVPKADIHESMLEQEYQRIKSFIEGDEQLNWMIQVDGSVVGAIWVDLKAKHTIPAPAVHLMIGDREVRGKGVGRASLKAVIRYLQEKGETIIHTRYITTNESSKHLLMHCDFSDNGEPYRDKDGITWQNVVLQNRA